MRVRTLIASIAFAIATAAIAAQAGAEPPGDAPGLLAIPAATACGSQNAAFIFDDLSGVRSPCAVAPGSLTVETLYYQNASRVGGTALAAYPLFRFRTGIARNLELVVDPPSQVAESGLGGVGLYPRTHLGYGVNYTFASNSRMAASVGGEFLPPSSRFVIDQSQPKYVFDMSAGYQLTDRATVSAIATGASSRQVGFNRIMPTATVRVAYDSSVATQISTDLGMRVVQRNSVAQTYGDIALNERLRKNVNFSVGLGTTFNPVSNAKAHYLAGGFNFHLK